MVSAGDFRNGLTIEFEGNVYQVIEFQHVKPGKGAAFVRTKLKNIKNGGVVEKTFRPTEKCPQAHIERQEMQYLYADDMYHFMNTETYDQIDMTADQVGDSLKFVKENEMVKMLSHNGEVFAIEPPLFVKVVPVTSARDMFEAVTGLSDEQDIIIKAAAVADYRPKQVSEDKVKKKDDQASIELERTDDILKYLGQHKKQGQFLCGFSMETRDMLRNSRAKLEKKNLDMVAANNLKVEGAGFQGDTNVLTLITQDEEVSLPLMSKEDAALKILDKILLLTTKAEA